MFRCCLPCRGGSAAPATSPPSSPLESETLSNIAVEQLTTLTTTSTATRLCPTQTSPLPHIEEEEESGDHHILLKIKEDNNSIGKENNTSIIGPQRVKLIERYIGDEFSNSPSPRTKINRKQAKGRTKSVTSTTSSETVTSTGGVGVVNNIQNTVTTGLHPPHNNNNNNKMQAEQGSIGDLQKYHTRYLKNRRHTLANVR